MSEQHHVVPIKIYVAVFLSLMILTALQFLHRCKILVSGIRSLQFRLQF